MFDLLKKTYLFGLGLVSLTKEKAEELVDDMIKRGEVAEKDRGKVIEDMLNRVQEEQEKLFKTVRDYVKKVVHDMGLPTRDEFLELQKRVDELENALQKKQNNGPAA
jgi:polyhydroxyalkanoate synthesis regulator phasin